MLNALASWHTFALALVVFGFAPGALLRLIVLAFHPDDPRRRELLAELHAVPRIDRPFWVLEQLEVALCEGLWDRVTWAATGRIIYRWRLACGVKRHQAYPDTFEIPSDALKRAIQPGTTVRLIFEMNDGWGGMRWGERMWVRVIAVKRRHLIGTLHNQPAGIPRLDRDDVVKFKRNHIIDIHSPGWQAADSDSALRLPPEQSPT
jgi:hypothetical protein